MPWHPGLTRRRFAAGLAGLAATPALAAEPLQVAQLVELTGGHAMLGDAWRNGVEMAAQELNAGGGVLGRPVQVTTYDAQSNAAGAHAAATRVLEVDPLAVLGPAVSDTARGALAAPRGNRALFTGAGAADLLGPAHPCTFRTVPGDAIMMGRLAGWLRDETRARRVALLAAPQEPFRSAHEALAKATHAAGLDVADAPWTSDVASDLTKLLHAPADALVLLLPPDSAGRALPTVRTLAPTLPVLGGAALTDPRALELAGPAAEGVRAHVLLADDPAAPELQAFQQRYLQRYKEPPGELAMAGYVALGAVAFVAGKLGSADPRALCEALRGFSAAAVQAPMLLVDSAWTEVGELRRVSWMVEVRNGRAVPLRALRDG